MPSITDSYGQNFSNRPAGTIIDMIIVHAMSENPHWGSSTCTALEMLSLKQAPPTWDKPWTPVSAHFLIMPTGEIHKIVAPMMRAWHAGLSRWGDVGNLNDTSVGFELAVAGTHDYEQLLDALSVNCFSDMQYRSAGWLTARLMVEFGIRWDMVRGHDEVAGDDVRGAGKGKPDPGAGFDWRNYYGWLAHYLLREPRDNL
jgi:N-acetyl-anhydromuramyl-L-alanine amidase AmpD